MTSSYETIGRPVGRAEGPAKVTGQAIFPADVNLPGTLVGKCLRSPFPYAKIVSIDQDSVDTARQVPGVHAVLTAEDIPPHLVGRMLRDMPILARDVVRFAGQKVVAVAADDDDIAEEALNLIQVEYDELDPILDPVEAMKPGATVLHPEFSTYAGLPDNVPTEPNVAGHGQWLNGDIEKGFAEADFIFEHTFQTNHQHQAYIEPHASVVFLDNTGRVQTWVNSKMPFQVRQQLSEGIDKTTDQIRVNPTTIGGDFGGKGGFMDTHLGFWLSKTTGRPVRMVMTYIEELMAGNPRHPAVMTFKTGVKKDGSITARQAHLVYDSGGYAAFKPQRGVTYGSRCLGPYKIPNGLIDSYVVYTNQVPCGSMRAPGDPQSIFAAEAQIDLIARELSMDPVEFRKKNLVQDGDVSSSGNQWQNVMGMRTLEAAVETAGYQDPKPKVLGKLIGRGMALCERHVGAGSSTVRVSIDSDGIVSLYTALPDTGSGFYTVLRQILGQELGVAYDEIILENWSTDDVDFETGVGGSRVTHVAGQAVFRAAQGLKRQLVMMAADMFGWSEDGIGFSRGRLTTPGQTPVSLGDLVSRSGGLLEANHTYDSERDEDITVFCVQIAEVEVDTETGQVYLTKFTSAHDVGAVLNPLGHQSQIDGTVMQGIGYALTEDLQYDEGHVTTLSMGEYKIPSMPDMPELRTVLVKSESGGPGPYGGKAIGEQGISSVAPAIINAILDATGVGINEIPVNSEKLLRAMQSSDLKYGCQG
ncbi:MAG: xanthine dehydrogenase family protein molybdopterin-binding subunit [Dehalococcoidia bacterium]|nr:xanthine dehydrogenase family protein molybdopterin-binding subunit [Dehalococcoidia bacterium]